MNKVITFIQLLLIAFEGSAFQTPNVRVVLRQGRWASVVESGLKMSAVEKSVTSEEINSRLEQQLQKLKEKDATSRALKKEVSILALCFVIYVLMRL